ncbi:peroxisomal 2,4-dienoyl-CoA reductase-like [Papaver somniferum]|uniref:peroxisomal 2,4-dienoyl-CoA reductase-like n=1 Tax=Papaver somniferum TaxID=3469 RepID=UPI000E6F81FA|nr:peroxisomal 2,4-dienoyl-CoA reductase-like [Papaver somniferum]
MESPFKVDIVKGKVALITEGGSRIGFEITNEFGKHGASVAIMGRRKSVLHYAVSSLRSLGIQAIAFVGDVGKNEDATRVVDATFAHFGRIGILVNVAAGNFLVPAENLSPNGFKTVMDIDTVGTFRMCHEALKYIKKRGLGRETSGGGTILNISVTLHYSATWYQIHVCEAKIPTMKNNQSGAPMHRFISGEKWDIAIAALYLASDAAKHINGTILVVDGGDLFNRASHVSKEAVKEMSRSVEKRSRSGALAPESGVPTRSKM